MLLWLLCLNADYIKLGGGTCADAAGNRFTRQQGNDSDDLAACKALCNEHQHCIGLEYYVTADFSRGCALLGVSLPKMDDGHFWAQGNGTGVVPITQTKESPDTTCYAKPSPATGS